MKIILYFIFLALLPSCTAFNPRVYPYAVHSESANCDDQPERTDYAGHSEKDKIVVNSNSGFSPIAVVGNSALFSNGINKTGAEDLVKSNLMHINTPMVAQLKDIEGLHLMVYGEKDLKTYATCDVLFKSNKMEFTTKGMSLLDAFYKAVSDGDVRLRITGHTDDKGGNKQNKIVSEKRAKAVGQYLIKKGFPEEKISMIGHGKKYPIASNSEEEGRRFNRRVEIYIYPASSQIFERINSLSVQ